MHVYVYSERGEAKFWLEPFVELAVNYRLTARDLRIAESIVREQYNDFIRAWHQHFGG